MTVKYELSVSELKELMDLIFEKLREKHVKILK